MTANLILHWYLDALSAASQALDSTDNHLNGTVAGSPQNRADERFGSALDLNGSTDAVTLADTKLLRLTTYTVEVWMKPRTPLGGVIGKPPGDFRLVLKPDGSVEHRFCTSANADENHATPAGAIAAGTWRHVAITNDGRTATIYVDGKQVSAKPYTGNRTVQNIALQVGQSYPGLLAHLRIYDGALPAEQIQRDMADDEAALAAFVRTHPVDFALLDVDQQPVLFIDDTPAGQPMILRLTNTSRQDIEVLPAAKPAALALHLRTGVLAVPPQPAAGTPGWTLQVSTELGTGDTVLGLACATATTIPRGGTYDIALTGLKADGSGGTRGTRAELVYQGMRYAGEKDQLSGNRIQYLEIVNRRGRKDIPLIAGFVGGNRVLSDGVTASTLRIRLANLSRDTALSLDGAAFTISYMVQAAGETREWALSDAGKAGQAVLGGLVADKATANWTITPENLGQRMQWTLRPPAKAAFQPDGSVVLTLSQVFALSSLGQAQILIGYQNVPGYQDGTLILTAEKSPLMFAGQRTGIGTVAPEADLQLIDKDQDPTGGTLIIGPTSQANLRFGYTADYSWIQAHGSKPLVINAIGNNITIGDKAPQAARLSVTADSAHLQLRRAGTAPAGKQMFLELYQDTTANQVYPFIRFNNAGKFWHRIEAREGGLIFKTGDPTSDALSNIGANIVSLNGLVNASDNIVVARTGGKHLQILRSGTAPDAVNGNTLYLELFQDNFNANNWPSIRFHQSNKFWVRIEGRTEGFLFKEGDLKSDTLVNIYAKTVVADGLVIGGVTLGKNEMTILQKLAAGNLQFDLLNVYQNEYIYAADYQPYDNDRRRVFTWRKKGQPVNQGVWRIISPR